MSPIAWKNSSGGHSRPRAPFAQADEEPERDADRHAGGRADREPHDAVLEVVRQDAVVDRSPKERTTSAGLGKEGAREQARRGDDPPQRDDGDEGHERARAPASASSQRASEAPGL